VGVLVMSGLARVLVLESHSPLTLALTLTLHVRLLRSEDQPFLKNLI
jgi:hypothetical protein